MTFNFEQNVSGTGFFAAYRYLNMPDALGPEGHLNNGAEAKTHAHGSGKLDTESLICAETSFSNKTWIDGAIDEDGEIIEDEEATTSIIRLKEDHDMNYGPMAMAVGTRYYASRPLSFNSLLSEDVRLKNRGGLSSIHHSIEDARGVSMLLDAEIAGSESDAEFNTSMRLEEDIVEGKAHFGVLHLAGIPKDEEPEEDEAEDAESGDGNGEEDVEDSGDNDEEAPVLGPAMKLWHKPLLEVDQDYVGTFHIVKNLNLYTLEEGEEEEDDWLPCCAGGYASMTAADQKYVKSAKGIFDCTCYKVPGRAQYPRLSL